MQRQRSEQEWASGGQCDALALSPHVALLGMLEAARVALVELSTRVVFVELVELVREALLQVEDLADYAVHGSEVTVIAVEAEDIAVALRDTPNHTRQDDPAWAYTVESLRKVVEHCQRHMSQVQAAPITRAIAVNDIGKG
jgi:hypothetical protein